MKRIGPYIFILFGMGILCSFFTWDKEGELLWRKNFKLTWKNFKKRPDAPGKYAAASSLYLLMNCSVKKDTCYFISKAVFIQDSSWYKKDCVSDKSLQHEQVHFDLLELYARFFRRTVRKISFFESNYNALLSKLQVIVSREWDRTDSIYDKQTNHSLITKKQEEWNATVENMLRQNEMYSNTLVKVVLRK